jgi:phospholipase/carboxylesterase
LGIRSSAKAVAELIDRDIARGVPAEAIVLAGFSQGGAMTLHVGLRETRRLAGILALSSYLPLARAFRAEKGTMNLDTPLFLAHGLDDPVVPIELGRATRRLLLAEGYHPEWHTYPMGHAVSPAEIADISRWLQGAWTEPGPRPRPASS